MALRLVLHLFLLFLALLFGCSNGTTPGSPDSLGGTPNSGGTGATQGGLQDMKLARELASNGVVPPADAFLVEGMLSEHDLPLAGPECGTELCLRGGIGFQGDAGWVQIGLSSSIDLDGYEPPSLQVVFVVDVSGSMGWGYGEYGEPARVTHDLLLAMIESFDSADQVGIVTFASSARLVQSFVPGSEQELLGAKIESLEAGGSTNMEAGLRIAHGMYDQFDEEGLEKRIILMTDAQPNVGGTSPGSFREIAESMADDGIGFTVIGTGIGLNPDVMIAMIDLRGGTGFSVAEASRVTGFMEENWPYLLSPIAYDLDVEITPDGGFSEVTGYGFPGDDSGFRVASVFLSRRRGALLLRMTGDTFEHLGARVDMSYRTPAGETRDEYLELVPSTGATPDDEGRYFEQYGPQKSTALASLVSGLKEAAELYGSDPEEAVTIALMICAVFESDAAALEAWGEGDGDEIDREILFANQVLELMQSGANQGTLYGGF